MTAIEGSHRRSVPPAMTAAAAASGELGIDRVSVRKNLRSAARWASPVLLGAFVAGFGVLSSGCTSRTSFPAVAGPAAASAGEPCAGKLDEMEKIKRLLAIVAAQEDAKFVRNGTAYAATEASEHLREKLEGAGSRVNSALEFIDKVGSRSSITGKEYLIEFPDGHTLTAGEFLHSELDKLEQCADDRAIQAE